MKIQIQLTASPSRPGEGPRRGDAGRRHASRGGDRAGGPRPGGPRPGDLRSEFCVDQAIVNLEFLQFFN